jgi:hypothetical protein
MPIGYERDLKKQWLPLFGEWFNHTKPGGPDINP